MKRVLSKGFVQNEIEERAFRGDERELGDEKGTYNEENIRCQHYNRCKAFCYH